jgi:hypothetical protein
MSDGNGFGYRYNGDETFRQTVFGSDKSGASRQSRPDATDVQEKGGEAWYSRRKGAGADYRSVQISEMCRKKRDKFI